MPSTPKPYGDFATLAEQDAWIRDQLKFFHTIAVVATDDAGWIGFKLGCTHRKAEGLIAQMRERTRAKRTRSTKGDACPTSKS